MALKFQLDRIAMNTNFALFEDLIVKFTYIIEHGKPKLEVFCSTKEALENDWQIYGANPNSKQDVALVQFIELGESKDFSLSKRVYRIKYVQLEKYEITYPKYPDEKVLEDRYTFEIEKLNSSQMLS